MSRHTEPAHASRVLALFPTPARVGRVVLDGFGLIPRSFRGFEVRRYGVDPPKRLATIIAASARRFRPAVVAVGSCGVPDELATATLAAARRIGLRAVRVPIGRAKADLLGAHPPDGYDKLAQVVVAFLPELADRVRPESARRMPRLGRVRRSRSVRWKACAVALALLMRERPLSAAALLRGQLPAGSRVPDLLARSFTRQHPAI